MNETRPARTAVRKPAQVRSLPLLLTLLLAPLALGTAAQAAPKISAQSIIVNPVQSTVSVRVWTDRDASGRATPNYAPGERIRLYTSVSSDAYVYLFNVDPNGKVDLILPNRYAGGENFIRANTVKAFPAAGDPFTFDIAAPYGVNRVLALASRTPLNLNDIATFQSQNAQQTHFADVNVQGQGQLAQALSIVVTPVPQNSWITAVASYNVVPAQTGYAPVQPVYTQPAYTQPTYAQPTYAQPAYTQPVYTAPSRPLPPIQPQPGYGYGQPVFVYPAYDEGQYSWRGRFSGARLQDAYAYYAAELSRRGYQQVRSDQRRNTLGGDFARPGSRLELRVSEERGQIDVTIVRRS